MGEDVNNPVSNVDGALLNGFTFAMDRAVKDVGSYSIVMQSNANSNYPGGLIFSNSSAILQITQKDLSVSNIVKEFDQRAAFKHIKRHLLQHRRHKRTGWRRNSCSYWSVRKHRRW